MTDSTWRGMHVEFGRLATARKIMGVSARVGSLTHDRVNAERWIRHFGGVVDAQDGATVEMGELSMVVRPAQEDAASPWVLYIHGGGMVHYSAALFEPFLRMLANHLHAPVEAFDYQKAPESEIAHSVDQLAESIEARCAALSGRRLIIAGDSVGGLLALYLSLRILTGRFSQIVMIYPVLDLQTERESYREFGKGFFLDADAMQLFKSFLGPFFASRDFDPSALSDVDLARLPDCLLVTAGCDVLRDEGLVWARQMADRSAPMRHRHFPNLPHDFCLYTGKLASADAAVVEFAKIASALDRTGGQPNSPNGWKGVE